MQLEGVTARPHTCSSSVPTRGAAALILVLASLVIAASAAASVTIHSADQVLAEWTVRSGDVLFFKSPGGRLWELVTDIDDPVIGNRGEGEFFPQDPEVVQAALDAISFPLEALSVDIFILPYPRRDLLLSNAGLRAIFFSPGVAPISQFQLHALVAHEMGHIVHNAFMPDWDLGGWTAYRQLRGIDSDVYNANAAHRNRPHEIFAEDFRSLFGDPKANYSGTIENTDLVHPEMIPRLDTFLLSLTDSKWRGLPSSPRTLPLYPDPARSDVHLALSGDAAFADGEPLTLIVYDVQGRLVARKETTLDYRWDGRRDDGTPATSGLYFMRATQGPSTWTGKLLLRR
jgi:hypothetical protein